jgi:hypothetical protein
LIPDVPVLFVVGVGLVAGFFFWEYHVIHRTPRAPLLSLALFTRARGRLAAIYFVGFVMWMGFISIGYHAQLYFQVSTSRREGKNRHLLSSKLSLEFSSRLTLQQVQMTGTIGALVRTLPAPVSGIICNFIVAKVVHSLPGQLLICLGLGATG